MDHVGQLHHSNLRDQSQEGGRGCTSSVWVSSVYPGISLVTSSLGLTRTRRHRSSNEDYGVAHYGEEVEPHLCLYSSRSEVGCFGRVVLA